MHPAAARCLIPLLAALCLVGPARAESAAGARHEAWRACLVDAFSLSSALSSPALAAEAALRECRASESDYLAALSTSPLLDDEDVTRARPALVARARTWLVSGRSHAL